MINKFDILIYLETLFNKSFEKITEEELLSVTRITVEFSDTINLENQIELPQLLYLLPNIKQITISNKHVSKELLDKLFASKIESLSFKNCSISSKCTLDKFENLTELRMINCALLDYTILRSLNKYIRKIAIINPTDSKEIDMTYFSSFTELNELYLEKCIVKNIDKILGLQNLRIISLLLSDIVDPNNISTFLNLRNLKDIYISRRYENLREVKTLSFNKNVYYDLRHLVLVDDIKNL